MRFSSLRARTQAAPEPAKMSNATSFGQGSSPELAALRDQKQVNGAGEAAAAAQVEDFGQAQALGEQAEALEARLAAAQ